MRPLPNWRHRSLKADLQRLQKWNGRRSTYTQRVLADRASRGRRGYVLNLSALNYAGALSAAGLSLFLYNSVDSWRLFSSAKIRCDSSKNFPHSALNEPVGTEKTDGEKSNGKEQWNFTSYGANQKSSADPDPPNQKKNAKEEKEKPTIGLNEENAGGTSILPTIEWSSLGDKITDYIVPDWVKMLPGFMRKLQNELSMSPGSLAEEIWQEANDPEINPEIIWDCSVRVSNELCSDEKLFLQRRKKHTTRALARFLDIPEATIHPDDVPIIAMCGSGGGLRALVAGSGSYLAAKEAGLFDCITYTAGVSGSCWLQTLFYSSIGAQSHGKLIQHLKNRLGVHIAYPPAALTMVNSAPTNKFLLSGVVEKLKGLPDADFGIVDMYGLLLAARLLVPKGELNVDAEDLKITNQRQYVDFGHHPLPIYTAVRHEIPLAEQNEKTTEAAMEKAKREAWFQWFEFTPYELWCEEWEAGIPTYAMGRTFDKGRTVWRDNGLTLPELRVTLLLGIWGSAFCATLSHYYREIRPVMKGLVGFGGLDTMIAERDEDLIKVHPIDPAAIPNFAIGMKDQLPASCPESIFQSSHLKLMDAGMSNNLPIYPLLRPGREVDVLIAFDASADVKTDNWLGVVDGYARQRNIKGWPMGAGWPPENETTDQVVADLDEAQAGTKKAALEKSADFAREDATKETINVQSKESKDLGFCNIWIGTTEERSSNEEPPPSKLVDDDFEVMQHPQGGIAVIYFPFLANPKVEGVDPKTSDFMSTWNFIYTPEQIDKVVDLARANFDEGREQTKRAVRAVYERKRAKRLEKEKEDKMNKRLTKLRTGTLGRKLGEGDHGNHFS